jgi:hypothetical protein
MSYSVLSPYDKGDGATPTQGSPGCITAAVLSAALLLAIAYCSKERVPSPGENQIEQARPMPVQIRYVAASRLHCRADASRDAESLTSFSRGQRLEVTMEESGWAMIKRDDVPCWVFTSYLTATAPTMPASPPRTDKS